MRICIERIGENAILMHFHAIVLDIHTSGESWRTSLPRIIDDFPAVWNLLEVEVIDTVGFLSFLFKVLLGQLLKFLLMVYCSLKR